MPDDDTIAIPVSLDVKYPSPQLVDDALAAATAAMEPITLGDHSLGVIVPEGYTLRTVDLREHEDLRRWRVGVFEFADVDSLAHYAGRYLTDDTLLYVKDQHGEGHTALVQNTCVAYIVLDDHPADGVGHRDHQANLILKPTAAARRWGSALERNLGQEQLLDLVVDGVGEIIAPDGAVLRDLVSDLHAIRSSEVKTVVRTGGEGSVVLAENVKLHAGTGNLVTFPETIKVAVRPFAGCADVVTGDVKVKATVSSGSSGVVFRLSAPWMDDELSRVVTGITEDLADQVGLTIHVRP